MKVRHLFLAAALPAAIVLVGCGPVATTSGGSKTTVTESSKTSDPNHPTETKVVAKDESLHFDPAVVTPNGVKQESTKDVTLTIKRGKDLQGDVEVSAKSSDPKVKVEVPSPKVSAAGDQKVLVKVTPAGDAAVDSEPTITVEAKAGKETAKAEFKVKVEKK